VFALENGPRVLSLYEGFFAGGARILHTAVVRSLDATTAQRHGVLSLSNRANREFTAQAIENDTSYRRLTAAGIPVRALDRSAGAPLRVLDLAIVEQAVIGTDVILALKEQPLAPLTVTGTGGNPLITCLHRSDPEHSGSSLDALVSLHEEGLLTAAVCCSTATRAAYHAATGIPLAKLPVIPNGVDLHRFRRDDDARSHVRASLGIPAGAPVVLLAARFDEMKDIPLFLRAARLFLRERPEAHFILCGAGMTPDNPSLARLVRHRLADRVHALGIRRRMEHLHNAADIVALTSAYGEAAPLCLLEGMATGAVPVTTDVGDAALLVGDARLVTGHRPAEVAAAWAAAYADRDEHRARIARHRQRLSEQRCFDGYAALIAAVAPVTAP
jgi:glycosyltransferase involved in cell wall biosynthesis